MTDSSVDSNSSEEVNKPMFRDLGGMNEVVEEVKMRVIFPMFHPHLFQSLFPSPISGILLRGPKGCGKNMLARAIANESERRMFEISASQLVSTVSVANFFSEAIHAAPSVVFIDEIDALAFPRNRLNSLKLTQLKASMQNPVPAPGDVLVIAGTTNPDACLALSMAGVRFDSEFVLSFPDETARSEILSALTSNLPVNGNVDLQRLARCTPGFVGADLASLLNKALEKSRISKLSDGTSPEEIKKLPLTMADFEKALEMVKPSVEVTTSVTIERFDSISFVKLEDVVGLASVKSHLQRIIRAIKNPAISKDFVSRWLGGVLFYGPTGCGKTLLAKAAASEAGANFIHIKGHELVEKNFGESEVAVQTIFSCARACSPCILFFDEVETLFTPVRQMNKVRSIVRETEDGYVRSPIIQILSELEELEEDSAERGGMCVIFATNRPELIGVDLLLSRVQPLYIPLPSPEERGLILKALAEKRSIDAKVDFVAIGNSCNDFSGADLAALFGEAEMFACEDKLEGVPNLDATQYTLKAIHFTRALENVCRFDSVKEQLENCKLLENRFKGI